MRAQARAWISAFRSENSRSAGRNGVRFAVCSKGGAGNGTALAPKWISHGATSEHTRASCVINRHCAQRKPAARPIRAWRSVWHGDPTTAINSSRRRLQAAAGLPDLLSPGVRASGTAGYFADPFSLGVASGDPTLTALCCGRDSRRSAIGGGMPARRAGAVVRRRGRGSAVMRRGVAPPDWAHSLHVEVAGLARTAGTGFLHQRRRRQPAGRSRTLPLAGAPASRLRLAVASCQHFEQGYFSAYRHMLDDDLDFIVHVGDYIYEGSWGAQVRRHGSPTAPHARRLPQSSRLLQTRSGPAARADASVAADWLTDVSNDYAGLVPNVPTAGRVRVRRRPIAPTTSTCRCAVHRPDTTAACRYIRASTSVLGAHQSGR